ncbi:hypothetical protein PYW07_004172 [Mythimna separata]|uniref:MICOS complex subunit MIC10 n=1 Tax=Mythimna separata TaxID=271217 RepID=A0AAD7YNI4_MYTSE|nr:hypothetical protein PYW07_004172 [Mythimna separata]
MPRKAEVFPDDNSPITTLRLCINDAFVKSGVGVLIGTLTSIFLVNRKRWPVIVGFGLAMGFSWANCR